MEGINVRTFADLPSTVSVADLEVYANGKYKMSGAAFLTLIIRGMGVRKVAQPSQVYSGFTVAVTIDIYVGEDWEVFRNGVFTEVGYNVGSGGKIASINFVVELENDEVYIVKREIFSRI